MTRETERIVLITGASRGIGAAVAARLAAPGTHVVVNYREKGRRAETIAAAIRSAGGQASTVRADLTDPAETEAMIGTIARRFGRLDALVLNASGGLELGADPGYATRLNRDAQKRLAELALPLMPAGARLVFVTSHQAHFFPHKAVPMGYGAVAASKRAGETALHAMRDRFDRAGVHLTVVSGDLIEGTTVVRLLERRHPDVAHVRRSRGPLPTVDEFAGAIAGALSADRPPSIAFVGGVDYSLTA